MVGLSSSVVEDFGALYGNIFDGISPVTVEDDESHSYGLLPLSLSSRLARIKVGHLLCISDEESDRAKFSFFTLLIFR